MKGSRTNLSSALASKNIGERSLLHSVLVLNIHNYLIEGSCPEFLVNEKPVTHKFQIYHVDFLLVLTDPKLIFYKQLILNWIALQGLITILA